jgi:hypothetical protein
MNKTQKILLGVGILGVAFGGFALTMYLTRKVTERKMAVIYKKSVDNLVQDYDVFNEPELEE